MPQELSWECHHPQKGRKGPQGPSVLRHSRSEEPEEGAHTESLPLASSQAALREQTAQLSK